MHRFYDYEIAKLSKKQEIIFPSYRQVRKHSSNASIGCAERSSPFRVRPEHMTACQHVKDCSSLNKTMVSFQLDLIALGDILEGKT
jgi:hypothetical protein